MVKSKEHANGQVKKIFYIEKIDFMRSMLEFALKSRGAEIYTIQSLENNFYLLDDLCPDLIMFDVESTENHLDDLFKYSSKAILVAVGKESDKSKVEGKVKHFLEKPLIAHQIAEKILSLLD